MDGINITLSAQVYSFFSFTESDALSWRNIMAMVNRIRQLKQLVIVTEQMWLWWLLKKMNVTRYTPVHHSATSLSISLHKGTLLPALALSVVKCGVVLYQACPGPGVVI